MKPLELGVAIALAAVFAIIAALVLNRISEKSNIDVTVLDENSQQPMANVLLKNEWGKPVGVTNEQGFCALTNKATRLYGSIGGQPLIWKNCSPERGLKYVDIGAAPQSLTLMARHGQ